MKIIALLSLAALALAAPKPDGPNPGQVYIESLSYGGNGCPQGTVAQTISSDRTTFTLIFDQYVAHVGPNVKPTEARKNCQINVNLRVPGGWAYTITTFDYRGYAQLARGHRATQSSIYYFAGSPVQARAATNFAGPMAKDYVLRDTIAMSSWVWSPCGARVPVNINTALAIDNSADRRAQSQMTTDSIDGKVRHVQGLTWRGC